jgi:hypothetical protein
MECYLVYARWDLTGAVWVRLVAPYYENILRGGNKGMLCGVRDFFLDFQLRVRFGLYWLILTYIGKQRQNRSNKLTMNG